MSRVQLLSLASRQIKLHGFEIIATALLKRCRLIIIHYHRKKDLETQREISPQRLVYYRDNWYLDAWCHQKAALRTFAVDSIKEVERLDKAACDIEEQIPL